MSDEPVRKRFTEFGERTKPVPDVELDEFWATLPSAPLAGWAGPR